VNRLRFATGIACVCTALAGLGVLLFGVVLYQTVPKGDLVNYTIIGKMNWLPGLMRGLDKLADPFYRGRKPEEPLAHYELRVDPAQLRAVERATETNDDVYLINEGADAWIQGELHADGDVLPIKMRVRGTRYNHWRFPKKSWRIDVRDGKLFRGMKEWNIIIPEDRAWFVDALSAWRAKKFDLLTAPTRFVTVSLNGSEPMLYLETEHWTKEMLEKLGLPGDANFYHAGDVGTSAFNPGWDPMGEDMGYWKKYEESAVAPENSYEELEKLMEVLQDVETLRCSVSCDETPSTAQERAQLVEHLFDVDELARWYALSLLAGDLHVGIGNSRFFFDPTIGKFRPFVWDIHSTELMSLEQSPAHEFWEKMLPLLAYRERTYQFLREYVQEIVDADLAEAERLRSLVEEAAYRDGQKFWSNREVKRDLDEKMAEVRGNIEFLRQELLREL